MQGSHMALFGRHLSVSGALSPSPAPNYLTFLALYLEKVLIIFILAKIEEKNGRNPGSFTKFKGG